MCVNYRNQTECVNFRKKNRMCVLTIWIQISKVVYVKKLTCSAPSTWVSKRHWVGQSEPVNPRPHPPLPPPLPTPSPPFWKMRSFRPEISEISAQAEISGRRKLLRPKSPDENSSDRSLWKVCLNFFAPPPSPSPSNKAVGKSVTKGRWEVYWSPPSEWKWL